MCTYIWTCEAVHVSSTCVLLLSPGWALAVCMYLYATPCTWRARHVKVQMMNAKCIVAPAIFASPPSTHTLTHTHTYTHIDIEINQPWHGPPTTTFSFPLPSWAHSVSALPCMLTSEVRGSQRKRLHFSCVFVQSLCMCVWARACVVITE